MKSYDKLPVRVLIADDEPDVREAYLTVLGTSVSSSNDNVTRLKAKLFGGDDIPPSSSDQPSFDVVCTNSAEEAVQAVRNSISDGQLFALVFLDMRMPPGQDGAWAAAEIRALDSAIDIVISTAYSDVNPDKLSRQVEPLSKMFYIQKPFHPHEVRQLAMALGEKRRAEDDIKQLNEDKIRRLRNFDALTGLPNRELFLRRMVQEIAIAERQQLHFAVIFLDLDNFKRINDTLGHEFGDQLLCKAAERLLHTLRTSDTVCHLAESGEDGDEILARMGGDEFTLLVSNLQDPGDALSIGHRIRDSLSQPVSLGEHSIVITPSIGISTYPRDGVDTLTLMKNADLAMYEAKQTGRNTVRFFNESMNEDAQLRLNVESELREAIARNELSLHYQPQMKLSNGKLAGFEALLRWDSLRLGKIPPLQFIPIAEETGLIIPIGEWVIQTACVQAKNWQDNNYPIDRIAVNVSSVQFNQPDFPDRVESILRQTGVRPEMLELEITESVLMIDEESAIDTLVKLKRIGVQLAIDDFGTGYSSLSYLKQFPIDRLKIDRSFIKGIEKDNKDQAIASAVIALAEIMKLQVTAEGVETDEQLKFLEVENCDEVQGFGISYPMDADDTAVFLRNLCKNENVTPLSMSATHSSTSVSEYRSKKV